MIRSISIAVSMLTVVLGGIMIKERNIHTFEDPIDGISIALPSTSETATVSYFADGEWSEWETLSIENEQDPLTKESNLVLFPESVEKIRIKSTTNDIELHPIRVNDDPVHYSVAARSVERPRILSRSDWGADDSFLYRDSAPPSPTPTTDTRGNGNGDSAPSKRIQDCEEAQRIAPRDFKTTGKETRDASGRYYRWAREYSTNVRLLAVHHTAIAVNGDDRPAVERVRALYQYHANNRAWGDIGYHYLIDEEGQVYEGKSGGKYVVGGHAYCNNVGTVGVALLGNFEVEEPTQEQMKGLQWLLDHLAEVYDIDLDRDVSYHGKIFPPVVGHGDLVSTECPGYYVRETLGQVLANVRKTELTASIRFPAPKNTVVSTKPRVDRTAERRQARLLRLPWQQPAVEEGVSTLGSTTLQGRPGDELLISVRYQAGEKGGRSRERVADVSSTNDELGLSQEMNGRFVPLTRSLLLPGSVPANGSVQLRLKVQLPQTEGESTLTIGDVLFTIQVAGRRIRGSSAAASSRAPLPRASLSRSSRARSSLSTRASDFIRIRLSYAGDSARLVLSGQEEILLERTDTQCIGTQNGKRIGAGTVRVGSQGSAVTIKSWEKSANRFRGILECRVIDGALVLINELPLEEYIAGLAEEPDTEPYEKQRAFAIAARTYAAHYIDSKNRKFPEMPYDGSDSPANFQAYGGLLFEEQNPRWVEAAESTTGQLLMKDGLVIKPPYFSSDDGRTRNPEEAGWKNFPFAEIFASKPDPWCEGMTLRGHGVGMSGCGAEGQANEGKTAEQILEYYYPGATITAR